MFLCFLLVAGAQSLNIFHFRFLCPFLSEINDVDDDDDDDDDNDDE